MTESRKKSVMRDALVKAFREVLEGPAAEQLHDDAEGPFIVEFRMVVDHESRRLGGIPRESTLKVSPADRVVFYRSYHTPEDRGLALYEDRPLDLPAISPSEPIAGVNSPDQSA